MLSDRYKDALLFAARLHDSQTRKGTEIAYLTYLMSVSALVMENGGNEDEAVAALLRVSCADKLHNARTILLDLHEPGAETWSRFRAGSEEGVLWYYRSLARQFTSRSDSVGDKGLSRLSDELERTVGMLEAHEA